MAIIKCPECGAEISDKAKTCIHCGCPIEDIRTAGTIRIKVSALNQTLINSRQKVTISIDNCIVWEGLAGEVAELHVDATTTVTVKYHPTLQYWGGECTGVIDPAKSKKYNVASRWGFISTNLVFQSVDIIDAD